MNTPQDELFIIHIRNFINDSIDHRQWLIELMADRMPNIYPDINSWIEGGNFPQIEIRIRIMDAIWSHNCDCKCIKPK